MNYSDIPYVNGDKINYGIDEISLAIDIYGKESEIYNAMLQGKTVSRMIKDTIYANDDKNSLAKILLMKRCIFREKGHSDDFCQ